MEGLYWYVRCMFSVDVTLRTPMKVDIHTQTASAWFPENYTKGLKSY